jgi:putative membrane-bound dehydrogenase-like protein
MPNRRLALLFACCFAAAGSAQKAPPSFRTELLLAAPEIEHPSCVTCDDDGNLFVAEDPMDMRGPATKEFDRIVLVKFGPDGKILRRTVFASGLSATFGMQWEGGWLYVMHAPHYSRLRDGDSDGVAEIREDLADGFGPKAGVYGFNDHIVSGIRLGMDGWMYVSVGDKGIAKATGKDGSSITLEGGGVVRMRPDGTKLQNFTSGTRNHVDVAMDAADRIFTYDNTDDGLGWWTRFTYPVRRGYYGYPYDYLKRPERHLPRISEHGGGSPCGAACYNESVWPATYRGSPFFAEWGKGKVQRFLLTPKGAGFDATIEDFLVNDGSGEFRPVDLCFSPDGRHMYVADWNFGGWVNPKVCGRVFRVTSEKGATATTNSAENSGADRAIETLSSPSFQARTLAQRALAKLGEPVREKLLAIAKDSQSTSAARVHSLWALVQGGARPEELDPLWDALKTAPAEVKVQAARAIGDLPNLTQKAMTLLFDQAMDRDPAVRLAAVNSFNAPVFFGALQFVDPDPYVAFARRSYVTRAKLWDEAGAALRSDSPKLAKEGLLTLQGAYDVKAAELLARAAASPILEVDHRREALEALAEVHRKPEPYRSGWWGTQPAKNGPARANSIDWEGTPLVLAKLQKALADPETELRRTAVRLFRDVPCQAALPKLRSLAETEPDVTTRGVAIQTLGILRDRGSVAALVRTLEGKGNSSALRTEAARGLGLIGDPAGVPALATTAADASNSIELAAAALDALQSLGRGSHAAMAAVESRLVDPRPALRVKATAAYAKLAGAGSASRIELRLKDLAPDVRQAAAQALGAVKARSAIPALIAAASDEAMRFEATLALSAMPDRRALPQFVAGLVDKNIELRQACREAVGKLRGELTDDLVAMNERKELTPTMKAELQSVLASAAPILEWKVAGPWPKGERPELNSQGPPDHTKRWQVGHKAFGWKPAKAREDGMVDLHEACVQADQVWCVAYAPIESAEDATVAVQVGSDDDLHLFLNGRKVYAFDGSRGWAPEQGTAKLALKKGTNHLYALVGNESGPWAVSVRVARKDPKFAFLYDAAPTKRTAKDFTDFAVKHKSDPARGKVLFADLKGAACIKCHAAGGNAAGPDLAGVGSKYPRDEIVRSILDPSNRILSGYKVTQFVLTDGATVAGAIKKETKDAIEIVTSDAKTRMIKVDEIEVRKDSNQSLMPNGLADGLSLQDFADIVGYLEGLKEAKK